MTASTCRIGGHCQPEVEESVDEDKGDEARDTDTGPGTCEETQHRQPPGSDPVCRQRDASATRARSFAVADRHDPEQQSASFEHEKPDMAQHVAEEAACFRRILAVAPAIGRTRARTRLRSTTQRWEPLRSHSTVQVGLMQQLFISDAARISDLPAPGRTDDDDEIREVENLRAQRAARRGRAGDGRPDLVVRRQRRRAAGFRSPAP
jgi:hypothetical protein